MFALFYYNLSLRHTILINNVKERGIPNAKILISEQLSFAGRIVSNPGG